MPRAKTRPSSAPAPTIQERPPLGIAMVGHAFMGKAHSNAFRQAPRFFPLPMVPRLQVVVGRNLERTEAAAEQFGFAEASTDLEAVLARDDIHLVDVATPNDSHAEITNAALMAGKHVLCEKPLALDLGQAKAMRTAAKRRKLTVGVWHNYRRCPATALAARMVADGDIGEVRQVRAVYLQDWLADPEAPASWRTQRRVCGSGAHGDLNAHLIDLTRAITGLEFAEVCGMGKTFTRTRPVAGGRRQKVDVDDAFAFLARFSNGAIGTFEATRVARGRKNHNCLEIHGTEGSLRWNLERMNELEVFACSDPARAQGFRTVMCMDEPHPYAAQWWPDGHTIGYEHTFVNHFADFVRCLAEGGSFRPDFDDGVRVQAVLDAALESAESRSWIRVPR